MIESIITVDEPPEKTLNDYAEKCANRAMNKGFIIDKTDLLAVPTKLMLIVTELSEACEEHRKPLLSSELRSDVNPLEIDRSKYFDQEKFDDEIADAFIRLFDFCGQLDIDIQSAVDQKLNFNSTRKFRHGKRY